MAKSIALSELENKQIDKRTERKIRSAMSKLVVDSCFFSTLLLQQKLIYTIDIPTMATDGESIYVNPIYAKGLLEKEIQGTLIHELYHMIFYHITRRGTRNPKLFNAACDYAINPIVKKEKFVLPAGHLDDTRFHGMSADKIYNILEKEQPEIDKQFLDILYKDNLSSAEKTKIEQNVKINIAKASTIAGDSVPDSIKSMIKKALAPKVDWKALLREFIQVSLGNDEATWKRPNRNFIAEGLYLPSYEGKTMPSIAIVIDVSGSIFNNKKLFDAFAGEIKKIVQDFKPEQVDVYYVDTRIHRHDTFTEEEEPTFKLEGGGGSSFVSAWPVIEKVQPSCIIAFTDCWITFPEHSSIDTLWICYENKEARVPFGKLVYAEE